MVNIQQTTVNINPKMTKLNISFICRSISCFWIVGVAIGFLANMIRIGGVVYGMVNRASWWDGGGLLE